MATTYLHTQQDCPRGIYHTPVGPVEMEIRNTFINILDSSGGKAMSDNQLDDGMDLSKHLTYPQPGANLVRLMYNHPIYTLNTEAAPGRDSGNDNETPMKTKTPKSQMRVLTGCTYFKFDSGNSTSTDSAPSASNFSSSLSETPVEALQSTVPKWSVGSAAHECGDCRPCAWHWKSAGCSNGASCIFCHLCDEGELKRRKKQRVDALRADRRSAQANNRHSRQWRREPASPSLRR
jgi:hypothetical protein